MHHSRSLLPDVEVLLGVMVKTSRCSTKLLFVVLNFYSWIFFIILTKFSNFKQISEFWPNFWISNKLQNINQISEFQPNFRILTKLWEFNQIPEFQKKNRNLYQSRERTCLLVTLFSFPSSSVYTYLGYQPTYPITSSFPITSFFR